MTSKDKQIPLPIKRYTDAYGLEVSDLNPYKRWLRDIRWNSAYEEAKEDGLSPLSIEFLDLFNAFLLMFTSINSKHRAIAYRRAAQHLHLMDEETIGLWFNAMKKEHMALSNASKEEYSKLYDKAFYFEQLISLFSIHRYSEDYWSPSYAIPEIYNSIRIAGAKDRHTGKPLVFTERHAHLLVPHYDLYQRKLSDRELLESEGILALHDVWKTTNDEEKQKIKRFVSAHAEDMNAVLAIVGSRYVDSLEQLEALHEQGGKATALMDGAL